MFLSLQHRLTALRDERGSALVAVIGVLVVTLIVTVVISASVISAMGFTTATRADVQSQAAAEAGIAVAQASLLAGTCATEADTIEDADGDGYLEAVFRGTNPEFTTVVKSWSGTTPENGCPTASATRVVVTGHGGAATPGLISRGDTSVVAAEFTQSATPPAHPASGPAVYSGGGANLNAMAITSATGVIGDIHVLSGDFGCTTTGVIDGSVLVANGNANITNTCTIRGNLWVSGAVTISAAVTVEGDVIAAGGGGSFSNTTINIGGNLYINGNITQLQAQVNGNVEATGSVYQVGGSRVKGDLKAGGSIRLDGRVDGNVTTPSTAEFEISSSTGRIGGNLVVGGNLKPNGHNPEQAPPLPTQNDRVAYQLNHRGHVQGSISFLTPTSPVPTPRLAPVVPPWVDFEYRASDWEGFTTITWPSPSSVAWPASAECQIGSWNQANHVVLQQITNATSPIVVRTDVCSEVTFSVDFSVKTDVAFIGRGFTIGGGADLQSGNGADHKVWFLVPDGNPTAPGPNCSNGAGNISTNGQVVIHDKITAFAYTPCTIALNNGTVWRGQLYSRQITVSSGDSLKYVPAGIPGWNLDGSGGSSEPPTGAGGMFDFPSSQRNVSQ